MTHEQETPIEATAASGPAGLLSENSAPSADAERSVAVGLALHSALADPEMTPRVAQFFDKQNVVAERQAALLDLRIERAGAEKAQIEGQIHHIAMQDKHLHLQQIHDKMRLVLDVGLAALGVALLVGIVWTLFGAATDRSIVVNAFTVSPKLENAGASGATVAAQFLDELIRLRESARADIGKRAVIDALAERVQIDVPEVHVSFGELRRLLHEALGHRAEIRGELTESSDGLALTLRGTNLPAKTFAGKPEELRALVTQAAEYVYAYADPVQMAYYLHRAGRPEETVALIRSRFASVPRDTQAILLNVWGNVLASGGSLPGALTKYRAAIDLNRNFWYPYQNLVQFLAMAGHEEEARNTGQEFERVARRGRWFGAGAAETDFVEIDALPSI